MLDSQKLAGLIKTSIGTSLTVKGITAITVKGFVVKSLEISSGGAVCLAVGVPTVIDGICDLNAASMSKVANYIMGFVNAAKA